MHHRGLSTARSALEVTWLLAQTPDGVRADEVAVRLGKSVSTAYNVLASMCDETVAVRRPGGIYQLAPEFRRAVGGDSDPQDLSGIVEDLLARTHKRAYAAVVRNGVLRVAIERGLQGMPKLPGLSSEIRDNAHALALGKVVLALSPADALNRYLALGLRPFTPNTITTREELLAELRSIRRTGIAVEREEFDGDFCSIAAPVLDARRHFVAAVGISMSRRAYDEEHVALQETVRDVSRFQASADARTVLAPDSERRLASLTR
ncbi:IclR family transcriptional regulator [Candidatus Solirubrobacter pratensis]|uniref:IclR family transcriptional regulator n=1 Tax=Candidatus Solirubrobacter pratensis TaxID=1298857 RepID=UPI00048A42B9|nr:IclR family transcriptional regulator C-terminal domain-containing protein [Candidatus Solirubrobacter pratensis]